MEGICSLRFVTFVKAHSPSGDADDDDDDDDPEQQADAEDDPVEYVKRAKSLRGRACPRDVSNAAKFKSFDYQAGFWPSLKFVKRSARPSMALLSLKASEHN